MTLPPDQPAPTPTPEPASSSTSNPPPPSYVPPIDYASLPGPFVWADFLAFKTMIAIPVIMVLFWVGVVWCVISGFALMFHHQVCYGAMVVLFGPFIVRIQCEFLIVVFRINETLTEVHNTIRNRKL